MMVTESAILVKVNTEVVDNKWKHAMHVLLRLPVKFIEVMDAAKEI